MKSSGRGLACLAGLLITVPLLALDGPNVVVNSGFNTDVSNWRPIVATPTWSNGAARLTVTNTPNGIVGDLRQCIAISGLTPGSKFRWGGKVFIPPGQAFQGTGYMYLVWVRTVSSFGECDGHAQVDFGGATTDVGQWVRIDAPEVTVPPGATGAQISFNLQPSSPGNGTFSIEVDDAYLFETGVTPSITIAGPASGSAQNPLTFEATASKCAPALNGWTWTATGGATLTGSTTRTVSAQWPSAGTFTITAANSACAGAQGSRQVTISVPPADLVVTTMPRGLVQVAQTGGGTDTLTLRNTGGQPTSVTLTGAASLATLSPAQFSLQPGEERAVAITGVAREPGAFSSTITVNGSGVARSLSIPLRLLSVAPPAGSVTAAPAERRVDVAAGPGQDPSGSVTFRNSGSATLTGILVANVPWIKPQEGIITIAPGATATATFTTDRAQRYDGEQLLGSSSGEISLVYPSGSATGPSSGRSGVHDTPSVSIATVVVVDTVRSSVTSGVVPPLGADIALFLAGVGHVQGSVGLFTTDLALAGARGLQVVDAIRMYFTAGTGGAAAIIDVPALPAGASASFADFVKLLFRREGEIGTVQIRSANPSAIAAAASVFNVSNPSGTYGTALPLIRSDVAIAAGEIATLSGLRSDSAAHTNLYVQETAGQQATVQLEFLDASGVPRATRTEVIAPFGLLQLQRVAPEGAVAMVMTNVAGSAGRVVAFATPVDRLSGDTWTVADWRQLNGYAYDEPLVIPIAGSARGANDTYFRTDVSITNTQAQAASATLRYRSRDGGVVERSVTVNARSTAVLNDLVKTLFGLTSDSLGFVQILPAAGSKLAVGSRTYTTATGSAATYGTGVPAIAMSDAMQAGDLRRLAGIDDAALSTINAAKPATFRSNLALMEVSGQPAIVRVTLRFVYPSGKATASGVASKDYFLNGNQFVLNSLTRDILGASRDSIGDLENLVVEIAVTGGDGRVAFFVSSVDNGTGDTVLRVE